MRVFGDILLFEKAECPHFFIEDPTIEGDPYPVGRVDAVSLSSGNGRL